MVDFVDVLVERAPVQSTVRPVMPCVLQNEEDGDLICHGEERRERYAGGESEVLGRGMEKPGLI